MALPEGWEVEPLPEGWEIEPQTVAPARPQQQVSLGDWLAEKFAPETKAGTALRGFGQGASLGLSEEMGAGAGANVELLSHLVPGMEERYPGKNPIEATLAAYRADRESGRRDIATGQRLNPKTAIASELAGAMAIPGGGLLRSAATGAGYGLGKAEGDVGEQLRGAATGGGLGLAGGAAGKALGAGAGWLGRQARTEQKFAETAAYEAEKAALEKLAGSARSALGGETSTAARTLEQAERAISDPLIDPVVKKSAVAFLASPEAVALRNKVVESSIERGGGQLGRIKGAAHRYTEAAADIPDRAMAQAAEKLDPTAVAKNLAGRAWSSIGQRALLGGAGALGGAALGGIAGGPAGGVAGGLAGMGLGGVAPGALQMARNVSKYAPAQALANRAVAGTAEAAVPVIEQAYSSVSRSPLGYAALQSLMDPEQQKRDAEEAMAAADRGTPR